MKDLRAAYHDGRVFIFKGGPAPTFDPRLIAFFAEVIIDVEQGKVLKWRGKDMFSDTLEQTE